MPNRPNMSMIQALRRTILMLNMVAENELTHSDVRNIVKGDAVLLQQLHRCSVDAMNGLTLYEAADRVRLN